MSYSDLNITEEHFNALMAVQGTLFGYSVFFIVLSLFVYMGRK